MIEPVDAHCFGSDPDDELTRVYGRYPVWTRLELVEGAQDNFRLAIVMDRIKFSEHESLVQVRHCLAACRRERQMCLRLRRSENLRSIARGFQT